MNKKDDNDQQGSTYLSDYLFKILLIGNSGVGKSCLLMRFSDNKFTNNFYNTIGVDFKLKNMMLEGKKIRLQIWDTAGQDRFRTITNSYYRNANGIMIIYDLTDRESFENVQSWYAEIDKNADPNVARILVGNKNDMEDKRRVPQSQGQQMANRYGIPFIETSAKSASNVDTVFHRLGQMVLEKVKQDPGKMKNTQNRIKPPLPPGQKPIENNSCCC